MITKFAGSKVDAFVTRCLKQMFKVIGQKYTKEFCEQPKWYMKHTWNSKQRDAYRDWFVEEYRKTFRETKKRALSEWAYFHLMWGFKEEKDA